MMMVYVAAAWALGIATASLVTLPTILWAWWLSLPIGLLWIWRREATLRLVHLCLLMFLLGALRYTLALPPTAWQANDLAFYNDRGTMLVVGNVNDAPDVRDRTTHVRLSVIRVRVENTWHSVSGLALVQVPRETEVRYGDQIQVLGEPRTPPTFDDFSYQDYLARQGIHSWMRVYGGVKILARDQGHPFFSALYAFRNHAHQTIRTIFPEPAASLLAGILLGIESGIPRPVQDAFHATNTAHIVAISGFNISIIAGILLQLARRIVGEQRATLIVIVGLTIYTLLVGAAASVVRAAIMGSLTVLARHVHRPNAPLNALAIATFLMLAWNPFTLYDVGFQLSFLATLGLILYVTPLTSVFEHLLTRLTSNERAHFLSGVVNDSFIVTLAAQITTTPLIVFTFHRVSLIGLATNLIVLPVQPAVMLLGGIATLVAMVVQPLGQLIAWSAWAFTQFTISVIQFSARLPFATLDVGRFDLLILLAYYALLFGCTLLRPLPSLTRTVTVGGRAGGALWFAGIALMVGMWFWNLAGTWPDGKTHIAFLDTGGVATFVQTSNGVRVLINGGAKPSATLSALGERLPFWDRTIDVLVLTEVDDEHLAGAVAVLEHLNVRHVLHVEKASQSAAYQKWRALLAEKNSSSLATQAGLLIELDSGVTLAMVTPSTVRLRANNVTVLWADSLSVDEQSVLTSPEWASTVLVAPRRVESEFVEAINPHLVVLFVGVGERAQPSPDTLALFAETLLWRTDEHGTIELTTDGQTLAVKSSK